MLLCLGKKQKKEDYLAGDNSGSSTVCVYDDNEQTVVGQTNVKSLQEFSKQKVLSIRRRLRDGTYDLDKYLDASLTKIFNELCR